MEEYIDENGNLYTVDEINKTAKEYNTNFQDIIKKNKLSLKSKKQEKVKAVKAEEPGKLKPVVKEDAPATVKSTASKSVKPSSASRTNLWGEDKSQPEFVTNLQKQAKTLVPKTKDAFNPKKFAKEVASDNIDGFYAKGEKNIQKSGVKEKKLEADIVDNVFNNFETLNYAKLTPEQKLDIDDQVVQILQAKQPVGTPYNIQPADIELKAQEILTKASDKKNKIIGESYIDRLLDGVAKGADYVGESFASIPETVYRVFAAPQNIYAAIAGDKNLEVTPEKFKKSMGVTNPIMDYFIDEQKRIGKKNNIYDNANYDSQSITENISNGNYSDAFRLLGSGLAESAPVSIGIMASGANMSIAKLAAASTAAMAGPEIRAQIEEKPGQSEIENVITGFGMAGAESVFSAIGEGSIGKVYKDIILKEGLETGSKIFKDGLITTYQTALKKYGVPVAMVGEGLEEVATKVTQNLISKKPAFEGTMDSFVAGVGGGTVYGSPIALQKSIEGFKTGVTTYKVNKQLKDSGIVNIKEAFDPNTPITEGQVNIALIPNSYKILNTQLDNDIALDKITPEEGENIKKEFALTYHATNKIKELKLDQPSNIEIINLIKEREALTTKIKVVDDPTLTTIQSARVKELNVDIEGVIKTYAKTEIEKGLALSEKSLLDTGEKVYEKPLGSGKSFEIFDTAEEAQVAYDKWAEENNVESEDIKGNNGFKLPNGQMLINKEQAIEVRALNVAPHELLHNIVDFEFSEPTKAETLKNKFLGTLSKTEKEKLDKKILAKDEEGNRLYTDEYLKNSPSEYATQFFELVRNGDITWSDNVKESLIRMWKSIFKPIFEKYGYKNIEFSDGRDIYNFVKDYSKSIEKGTLSTRAKKLLKKGEGFTGVTSFSKTVSDLKTELANIKENEFEYDDPYEYDQEVRKLEGELKRAVAKEGTTPTIKKEVSEEDTVKEIIKNESGSISSNKVQQIYETKGKEGAAEIIKLFKPITNKIVDKRRDAPDFDRELLTDEIETGVGGILDLITKYKPESGTPLAAWINKYLPVRAIATSRRILGKQFSKEASEEKGLIATETADQGFAETAKEKPKYKNALEAKVFPAEVLETAIKKIITITRTLKSRIDTPVSLNKTVTPLISEIRDEVGKQLDIDIKTMLGGKKDGVLKKELLRTKRYVLENMTTTWLMGKDGQGGIPMAIQKQVDGKWINFPDWVGKKIDREKTTTDQAGRTSGAELVRRLPNVNNNISDEVFLAQIIGPDGNPIRGRKESLSKAMSEEGAFDIINADLADEGPIFDALATNQERLGYEMANNFAVTFSKQSERGNIKTSKQIKEAQAIFEKLDKDVKFTLIGADGSNFINFIKNVNNEDDVERKFNLAYGDTPFEPEDRNKIVNAIKGIYSFYKKQSGKSTAKTYGINLNEDFESFANRKIFNALSKDQSLALTVNIPSSDLKWKSDTERKAAQVHMKNFYNSAIKNFTENKKMSNVEAKKLFTRLFSRAFSYGKDQSLFNNQQGFFNAFLNKQPGFTIGVGEIRGKTILYKGAKVNSTIGEYGQATSAKDISEFIKTGNPSKINIEERKAISTAAKKDLKTLITALKEMYENGQVNDIQLGLIFKSLGGSMNSTLKLASELRYVAEKGNYSSNTKEWVYEHVPPSSYISRIALGIITGKTDTTIDEFMDKLINNSYVTILPKSFDKSVNELYKSNMPFYYEIGDNPLIRYLDAGFNGKETPAFYDLYDKKQINNAIVKDAFSSKIIKDTQEAVLKSSKSYSKTPKGISVFDFDDTVGLTSGSVLYTMPDGTKGKLNAEEFAKEGASLLEAGAVFDFSEFSKVVDGKPGPMVEKMKKMIGKFGPENFFILTARPANAAGPIHEFLSSIGIDIPLENITGLGSSLAQSKADWMTAKAAEGYNDFYFADDAIQNVEAVKNALDVLDVKSKIQQARIKFSKTISPEFNKIIEENKGMEHYKVFSDIVARRRGKSKNKFDFYVPPSAADFELLLYNFLGKGERGEEQQRFFNEALLKPYANGNDLMDAARQSIKKDYKALLDSFPDIRKKMETLTPDGDYTYDQAIRVAMWNEEGVEIPGISERDSRKLTDLVNNDPELAVFKQGLIVTGRQGKGWINPTEYWDANTIIADLHGLTEGEGRKKFLAEFIDNAEQMFGTWSQGKLVGPNINKVEAVYGSNVREAIEDVLYRMTTGKNRSQGKDKETSAWSNWVNGSTGAIMFLNTRSAALQLIGAVNFLNLRDNNPFAAGKAFLNQPQYWKDFSRIWNSDKMKERRGGLKEDVAAAEIANAAAGSKNKPAAVIAYLLKIGYTPTQLADSFAIASGGAPFYRNRIKSYLKEGLTEQEAEDAAWSDFTKVSDETQQSGDPRDISKQQASGAGRLLLTFQNTAMQQSRIVKKSYLDLRAGRGNAKTHISKIVYYLAVQNTLFAVLQQGLFAVAFDDDDEEKDKEKEKAKKKTVNERLIGVADGVLDTILRGTGFAGGVVSVLKNMTKKYLDEKDKNFKADYAKVVLEGANISPPIGSKLRKVYTGLQQTKFEKDLIKERGWSVMQDGRVHLGPMYGVTGKLAEATTNLPIDRLVNKIENVSQAMNSENQAWQRVAVGVGFTPYSLGIEESKGDLEIRAKAKEIRKEEGKIKSAETRQRTKDSIRALPIRERVRIKREAALKRREEKKKRKMG